MALVAACVAMPSVALAGSPEIDAKRGRAMLGDFAKCVVKRNPTFAKRFVWSATPATMSDDEIVKALDPRCFGLWGMRIRISDLPMKAALAEELVRQGPGRWPDLNASTRTPLNWGVPRAVRAGPGVETVSPSTEQDILRRAQAEAVVGQLGECVARTSPEGAVAVLNTKIDSRAELAAMKALSPHIANCVSAGQSLAFNRTNLRYAIALSYYRLAFAPAEPIRREASK